MQASPLQGEPGPADARFSATLVADHVWQISDKGSDNIYLVEGKEKALLIDTGLGIGRLGPYVRTLTKLPITVVNTHGHPDHAGGNFEFDDIFAHPADFEAVRFFDHHERRAPQAISFHQAKAGDRFDLGGRTLEVIEVPGHTPGSICLLDAGHKLLFTGDNDNTLVWLFLKESLPLETYLETLQKLKLRADRYETLLPGHGEPLEKSFLEEQIACAQTILDGSCSGKPYNSPVGKALVCGYKRASIAYDPEKLRQKK
jgi:glyoxylase-like metal-dependent hydrolase (beta-lactamase superfamily II)